MLTAQTARAAMLLLACLALNGCTALHRGFLYPAGPIAAATRHEFLIVCFVMLFVIGPVMLLAPLFAWHYRLSNTESAYRPEWGFNWPLEGFIWIPPALIVAGLSVYLWRYTQLLDPYRRLAGPPIEIEAVALDWKWVFIYPAQNVAIVNRLVIPAGRPVHLSLTSGTVMQSILMPRLAGQIYAMAGMRTQLNFAADAPGAFMGENVQFNGAGFQNEKFAIAALNTGGFATWLAEARAQPNRLDATEYELLSRRSTLPHPLTFGAVDAGLFDRIVTRDQASGHVMMRKSERPRQMPMNTSPSMTAPQ